MAVMMLESVAFCRSLAPKAGLPGTSLLRGVPLALREDDTPWRRCAVCKQLLDVSEGPAPPEMQMKSRQSRA